MMRKKVTPIFSNKTKVFDKAPQSLYHATETIKVSSIEKLHRPVGKMPDGKNQKPPRQSLRVRV